MAKAILEYDLNDNDDAMAHLRAIKSLDMALVLWTLAYNTKKKIQQEISDNTLDGYEAINKFYDIFWEEMNNTGINLDDLIV